MIVTFTLPMPPSTNALYRNVPGKGRVKTADYKAWIKDAGWQMKLQGASSFLYLAGPLELRISLSAKSRIDVDNIKALPDLLKKMGVIDDDKQIRRLYVDACLEGEGVCMTLSQIARPV